MAETTRLTLRLPPELHQLLLDRAAADHRSLNREIEFLLWQVFQLNLDAFSNTRFTAPARRSS
ncbi:MAG TPA: Arc family DNA-binding protein [Chloroflexota bacterium]|nr:Arc family DNA-binding protein [Chloroflexota bacterium]